MVWKVRHSSVLYLGCRVRLRSSWKPCANWHFSPYLHVPLSWKGRHSSVLKRMELICEFLPPFCCCCKCRSCWLRSPFSLNKRSWNLFLLRSAMRLPPADADGSWKRI